MIDETLAQQFLDYCEDQQNLSPYTIIAYKQDLKAFMIFYRGTDNHDESEQKTILRFVRYLRNAKSLKASTVQRRLSTLRRCFRWRGQILRGPLSPFHGLELKFRKPKTIPRSIDAKTLQHLMTRNSYNQSTIGAFSQDDVMHLMLKMLITTGLRIGELTGLNIKDVFNHDRKIKVLGKGSKERIVFVANSKLLIEFKQFMAWRRQNDKPASHLFPNRCGDRLMPPAFRKRLKLLCEDKGIAPHLTPHQFRHSAATLLIENEIDIRVVQRLLGHASIATTEIYTHVSNIALQRAITRADILAHLEPEVFGERVIQMRAPNH